MEESRFQERKVPSIFQDITTQKSESTFVPSPLCVAIHKLKAEIAREETVTYNNRELWKSD